MAEDKSAPAKTDTPNASDTSDQPQSTPTASPETEHHDRGIFVPAIFGGAVATALGFFGGQLDWVEERFGLGSDDSALVQLIEDQAAALDTQAATLQGQADMIEALTARLEEVAAATPEIDLSGITGQLETQAADIATLALRVEDIEKRPMTESVSEDAIAAYEAELERLQASVAAQRDEIEALLSEARTSETSAEERARIALARALMSRIITAVDSGAPYAEALAELEATGGADVPAGLAAAADTGVPTLIELQDGFPSAARAALNAARSAEGGGGLGAFIERQLGARSVEPREGDDADAVLSRAEAAIRQGRLGDALAEVDTLPDAAKASMADWISKAEMRHAASRAADELMTALATN